MLLIKNIQSKFRLSLSGLYLEISDFDGEDFKRKLKIYPDYFLGPKILTESMTYNLNYKDKLNNFFMFMLIRSRRSPDGKKYKYAYLKRIKTKNISNKVSSVSKEYYYSKLNFHKL